MLVLCSIPMDKCLAPNNNKLFECLQLLKLKYSEKKSFIESEPAEVKSTSKASVCKEEAMSIQYCIHKLYITASSCKRKPD
jgi:hypothetical protein